MGKQTNMTLFETELQVISLQMESWIVQLTCQFSLYQAKSILPNLVQMEINRKDQRLLILKTSNSFTTK